MKHLFLSLCIGLAGLTSSAHAQSPTKPKEPYVAAVPDYGHWMIRFKYEPPAEGTAAPAPVDPNLPTILDTIKTGDLKSVVLTLSTGTTQQFTYQGDWVLSSTPEGPKLSVATADRPPHPYFTTGFALLDGLTIDNSTFKEATTWNGVPAFHYRIGETDVWIDSATMLPLALRQPGLEASYQFLPPPPKPFLVPEDQEILLKKQRAADKKVRTLR
jgi:hypothetical protein